MFSFFQIIVSWTRPWSLLCKGRQGLKTNNQNENHLLLNISCAHTSSSGETDIPTLWCLTPHNMSHDHHSAVRTSSSSSGNSTTGTDLTNITTWRNLRRHSLAFSVVALFHGLSQWSAKQYSQLGPSVPCWHMHFIFVFEIIGPGTSSSPTGTQWVACPLHWHLKCDTKHDKMCTLMHFHIPTYIKICAYLIKGG